MNELNLKTRQNSLLKADIEQLKLEQAGYKLQPYLLVFTLFMNLLGIALVAIGANLLTAATPSAWAGWIFGIGIAIAFCSAVAPVILPPIIHTTVGKKMPVKNAIVYCVNHEKTRMIQNEGFNALIKVDKTSQGGVVFNASQGVPVTGVLLP